MNLHWLILPNPLKVVFLVLTREHLSQQLSSCCYAMTFRCYEIHVYLRWLVMDVGCYATLLTICYIGSDTSDLTPVFRLSGISSQYIQIWYFIYAYLAYIWITSFDYIFSSYIYLVNIWDSSVCIVMGYRPDRLGFNSWQGHEIILFSIAFRLVLGLIQPPVQCVLGAVSFGVKQPSHKCDYSSSSGAKIKNSRTIPTLSYMSSWHVLN
jgi:hypothetical protein